MRGDDVSRKRSGVASRRWRSFPLFFGGRNERKNGRADVYTHDAATLARTQAYPPPPTHARARVRAQTGVDRDMTYQSPSFMKSGQIGKHATRMKTTSMVIWKTLVQKGLPSQTHT